MNLRDIRKRYSLVFLHVLVWLVYIFIGTLNRIAINPHANVRISNILLNELPIIYVFYGDLVIFRSLLGNKRYFRLAAAEILFFLTYVLVTWVDGYRIYQLVSPDIHPPPIQPARYLIECFWLFFLYSFLALGYFFAMQAIRREKQLRLAQEKELRFEQEKLLAEYAFLRTQINPHFLHNTLNYLYAKSLPYSKEVSDGILTLSEIMQYSLEDANARASTVPLTNEVNNLRKVIKIHQLRFSNRLNIEFSIQGNTDNINIIPLVIITIVENALKHGELSNPSYPVVVRIDITGNESESSFRLYVRNRKKTGPKERGYGIGMDNVKKRLAHYYQQHCSIVVKEDDEFYTVELSISPAGRKNHKLELHDKLSDSR